MDRRLRSVASPNQKHLCCQACDVADQCRRQPCNYSAEIFLGYGEPRSSEQTSKSALRVNSKVPRRSILASRGRDTDHEDAAWPQYAMNFPQCVQVAVKMLNHLVQNDAIKLSVSKRRGVLDRLDNEIGYFVLRGEIKLDDVMPKVREVVGIASTSISNDKHSSALLQ